MSDSTEAETGAPARLGGDAIVLDVTELSPWVRGLVLHLEGATPFDWQPGQYVEVIFENGERRPFSIASAPDPAHPGRLELAAGRISRGIDVPVVAALVPGARVQVLGPGGRFVRDAVRDHATLLIGTGTGVAPLRAMIQAELRRGGGPFLILLVGARTEEDLLYREELEDYAARHPRFTYEPVLSRPDPGWTGRTGYVQHHLDEILSQLTPEVVFLCGSTAMVDEARDALESKHGITADRIFAESYG